MTDPQQPDPVPPPAPPTDLLNEQPTEPVDRGNLQAILDHQYRTQREAHEHLIRLVEAVGPYVIAILGLVILVTGFATSSGIAQVMGGVVFGGGGGTKVGQALPKRS